MRPSAKRVAVAWGGHSWEAAPGVHIHGGGGPSAVLHPPWRHVCTRVPSVPPTVAIHSSAFCPGLAVEQAASRRQKSWAGNGGHDWL